LDTDDVEATRRGFGGARHDFANARNDHSLRRQDRGEQLKRFASLRDLR
jgi:hypothetical protein